MISLWTENINYLPLQINRHISLSLQNDESPECINIQQVKISHSCKDYQVDCYKFCRLSWRRSSVITFTCAMLCDIRSLVVALSVVKLSVVKFIGSQQVLL